MFLFSVLLLWRLTVAKRECVDFIEHIIKTWPAIYSIEQHFAIAVSPVLAEDTFIGFHTELMLAEPAFRDRQFVITVPLNLLGFRVGTNMTAKWAFQVDKQYAKHFGGHDLSRLGHGIHPPLT